MKALIPVEMIEKKILLIRDEKVMLDADLAEIYGVTTKRLNELTSDVNSGHQTFHAASCPA
jgi:hypothetical protein